MDFLCSGLFWGSILILFGISVILKAMFHIHIPLFRLLFALILIYLGIRVLVGGAWCRSHCSTVMFSESSSMAADDKGEYSIIFGRGVIDTGAVPASDKVIRINTIFGASVVKVPKNVPTIVKVDAAFSSVKLPDGNIASFGTYIYKNKACAEAPDSVARRTIRLDVVFGSSVVEEQ